MSSSSSETEDDGPERGKKEEANLDAFHSSLLENHYEYDDSSNSTVISSHYPSQKWSILTHALTTLLTTLQLVATGALGV